MKDKLATETTKLKILYCESLEKGAICNLMGQEIGIMELPTN